MGSWLVRGRLEGGCRLPCQFSINLQAGCFSSGLCGGEESPGCCRISGFTPVWNGTCCPLCQALNCKMNKWLKNMNAFIQEQPVFPLHGHRWIHQGGWCFILTSFVLLHAHPIPSMQKSFSSLTYPLKKTWCRGYHGNEASLITITDFFVRAPLPKGAVMNARKLGKNWVFTAFFFLLSICHIRALRSDHSTANAGKIKLLPRQTDWQTCHDDSTHIWNIMAAFLKTIARGSCFLESMW